jgi:DNA-binding IclR family transcriptional regulator
MSENRSRNEAGQFVATRSADDVLKVMTPLEPYSARELAETLGWPRRTVHKLLSELHEEGRVRRKKTGHRTVIWIRPDSEARS